MRLRQRPALCRGGVTLKTLLWWGEGGLHLSGQDRAFVLGSQGRGTSWPVPAPGTGGGPGRASAWGLLASQDHTWWGTGATPPVSLPPRVRAWQRPEGTLGMPVSLAPVVAIAAIASLCNVSRPWGAAGASSRTEAPAPSPRSSADWLVPRASQFPDPARWNYRPGRAGGGQRCLLARPGEGRRGSAACSVPGGSQALEIPRGEGWGWGCHRDHRSGRGQARPWGRGRPRRKGAARPRLGPTELARVRGKGIVGPGGRGGLARLSCQGGGATGAERGWRPGERPGEGRGGLS